MWWVRLSGHDPGRFRPDVQQAAVAAGVDSCVGLIVRVQDPVLPGWEAGKVEVELTRGIWGTIQQ